MTRRELIESMIAATEPIYGAREAAAIARLVAEKRYGLSRADIALDPNAALDPDATINPDTALDPDATLDPGNSFRKLLADLAAARPVQYILGVADFDDMELAVGEGVLIPRPETGELVRWIDRNAGGETQRSREPLRILDIGTGSGAIAIALARRLPQARVTAMDISPKALEYARLNIRKHIAETDSSDPDTNIDTNIGTNPDTNPDHARITLLKGDILKGEMPEGRFDIIVSNPPYIPAAEKARMAPNVANHEPAQALFVPDDDPLVFYRAIARFARRTLAEGGSLWFEAHETTARSVVELLEAEGFADTELREDINSKPRMIRACPETNRPKDENFKQALICHP